jgi:hypothetical protein
VGWLFPLFGNRDIFSHAISEQGEIAVGKSFHDLFPVKITFGRNRFNNLHLRDFNGTQNRKHSLAAIVAAEYVIRFVALGKAMSGLWTPLTGFSDMIDVH